MFKFIVTECLIFFIIGVSPRNPIIEFSSLTCSTPIEYYVELSVTSNRFSVKSDCLLNVTCQKPIDKISIYRKQCDLQTDSINVTITEFPLSSTTLLRHPVKEQLYRVDIKKTEIQDNTSFPITPGVYGIAAKGVCALNYEGCFSVFSYRNDTNYTKQVFVSHDRDDGVAWVVPLWYNQRVKANFSISIRHDKTYTAVSHFPGRRFPGNSKTIVTRFGVTSDIPINLVSVALVPEEFTDTYIEERFFFRRTSLRCRPEIEKYVEHAHVISYKVIVNFERKNSFSKYWEVQYIVIPNYKERLTVTPGLVFLRESEIIYDEQGMTNSQKIEVELLAASSVIYHIFVDLFIFDQSDDSWFHEALLKYFAFTELYEIYLNFNDTRSLDTYIVQSQWELLYVEALNTYPLSNEINTYSLSFLRNIEAFRTLRMLDLSPRNVSASILSLSIHTGLNSTSSANIWDVVNDTIDHLPTDLPMTKENGIDKWITQDYIILKVKRNSSKIEVRVKCTSWTEKKQCNKRFIPITYTIGSIVQQNCTNESVSSTIVSTVNYTEFRTYTERISTNYSDVFIVDVPSYEYFIVNAKHFGYYRVNYDRENWRKIARYLHSTTDFKDPVTCAQLLDDAFYFLVRNTYDRNDVYLFFELANYLSAQTNYTVWYPMMNALEYLSKYLPLGTIVDVKSKILPILNGFLTTTLYKKDTLLFEKNDTLSYHLRYEVLKWACILKDARCNKYIKYLIIQDINNSTENRIMVGWRERFYRLGFLMEKQSYKRAQMWHTLYTSDKWSTTELLDFLTCSTNYETMYDSLMRQCCTLFNGSKSCDSKLLQDEKIVNKVYLLLAKRAYNDDVLEMILQYIKHMKTRANRVERPLAVLTIAINNIYSVESFTTMLRFTKDIGANKIDLRTKYENTFLVNVTKKKLRDHFQFPWMDKWNEWVRYR